MRGSRWVFVVCHAVLLTGVMSAASFFLLYLRECFQKVESDGMVSMVRTLLFSYEIDQEELACVFWFIPHQL